MNVDVFGTTCVLFICSILIRQNYGRTNESKFVIFGATLPVVFTFVVCRLTDVPGVKALIHYYQIMVVVSFLPCELFASRAVEMHP